MELKINNQTKQFALDSLTVQALLDLKISKIILLFKKTDVLRLLINKLGLQIKKMKNMG
jgi:hypothetical protein